MISGCLTDEAGSTMSWGQTISFPLDSWAYPMMLRIEAFGEGPEDLLMEPQG